MNRRSFLLAGSAVVVAGCRSGSTGTRDTTTPSSRDGSPPSTQAATSDLASLKFSVDWLAGGDDGSGRLMGGTEVMWLASHEGRLYAAVGYWKSPLTPRFEGAQVLRKDSSAAPWVIDAAFPRRRSCQPAEGDHFQHHCRRSPP